MVLPLLFFFFILGGLFLLLRSKSHLRKPKNGWNKFSDND